MCIRDRDDRLLGAQLMCPHAGEMIGGLTAAINAGLTAAQLRAAVWPHPCLLYTSRCV